jgi:hypothetical protein
MSCKSKCEGTCGGGGDSGGGDGNGGGGDGDGGDGGGAASPKTAAKPKEEKNVDVKTLNSYKALNERFGPTLEAKNLLSLAAQAVETIQGLKKPGRAEERNADKLYLWFETNWAKIADKLDQFTLLNEEEEEEDLDGKT